MKHKDRVQLRKNALKRISCNAGESISETLIALLVAALALTMFAGAISSSANVINKGRIKMDEYYDANESIVTMTGTSQTGKTVTITDGSNFTQSGIDITYYTNDYLGNTSIVTYKKTS